jgi:hypothetical protein
VRLDVALELYNPNDAFTVTSSHLELLETRDGADAVLARGKIDGSILIPQSTRASDGTQALQPVRVAATLILEKASLDADALVAIKSGRARIRGDLVAARGFPWPPVDIDINTPLPKFSGELAGEQPHFEPKITGFKKIAVALTAEGKMNFRVRLTVENPSAKAVTLDGLLLAVSASATKNPLRLTVQGPIELTAEATQETEVVALAGMDECDPTLLDDIQADGRKAKVEFTGTFKTEAINHMKFDETRNIVFAERAADEPTKTPVTLENLDHAMLVKLLKLNEWPMALINNPLLASAKGLLKGQPTPLTMPIRNPIPGTVKIEVKKFQLMTPPKKNKDGSEEAGHLVLSADSEAQSLPPRDTGNATIRVTLGPKILHSALFYIQEVFPNVDARKGFTLEQAYAIDLPLFGSVPVETKTVYE